MRLNMPKLKTCHSILVGHFALAVVLSVLFSWCVVSADDEFRLESTDHELTQIMSELLIELANKAEVALDGWRTWYCQEFQSQFYNNQSAWSFVMTKCIDPLVSNPTYPANLLNEYTNAKVEKVNTMVLELHAKCSNLVENPCFEVDWLKVKKCVRDDFMFIPSNGFNLLSIYLDPIVLEKALIYSLLLDSEISKCTFKTLASNSSGP